MGGNVVMIYAGVRPAARATPGQPRRLRHAGDEAAAGAEALRAVARRTEGAARCCATYDSVDAVAERLRKTNPLLPPDRAAWLARHWSRQRAEATRRPRGRSSATRRTSASNPMLYRKEEVLECWKLITAPVLWVEGDRTDMTKWWGDRYPRADFEARLAVVPKLERVLHRRRRPHAAPRPARGAGAARRTFSRRAVAPRPSDRLLGFTPRVAARRRVPAFLRPGRQRSTGR